MKLKVFGLLLLGTIIFAAGCRRETTSTAPPKVIDPAVHKSETEKWQSDRLASLTKEDGWLTLIGLFWLNEGENKFGSFRENPVVLPRYKAPPIAGSLWLENGRVRIEARPGVEITADGNPVSTLELKADIDDGGPTILKLGSLIINVVKRGDRLGVRVKDSESVARSEFKGLEYFPIDPKWRLEARFEPYQPAKKIPITNVLGMTDEETSPGAIAFDFGGRIYRIDPIIEKGEKDLFVMIADGTTGKESYGAGRYLYVSPPDAAGKMVIDFNKAYNPPCAFTNYATCPLPPKQNRLPFRIEAGEKKYASPDHLSPEAK
jgi:uncharacterized protein (DUF1684 family)